LSRQLQRTSLDAGLNLTTLYIMSRLGCILLSPVFLGIDLLAQNSTGERDTFEDKSFWEDVLNNPGEYSYVLIIFVILGYVLWRVQRLGEDD